LGPKFDKKALNERKKEIIGYVKGSPLCSKDSVFTKGRIPKSKVTIELFAKLVSQKKILKKLDKRGKVCYYVKGTLPNPKEKLDTDDLVELLRNNADSIEKGLQNSDYPKLRKKLIEFYKIRAKVLELERKRTVTINEEGTRLIVWHLLAFQRMPSKIYSLSLMDILSWAIIDDKYYLKHQLHSTPREREYKFQKAKKRHVRRSITDLLGMKEKGRHEYSLLKKDYDKHMKKIKNEMGKDDFDKWISRYFAERHRSLYNNPSKLQDEIFKEASKQKFKPKTEEEKRWKKYFDECERIYPKIPMKLYFECLSEKEIEEIKAVFKEDGLDYEEEKKWLIDRLDNVDPNTFLSSQPSS